MIDVLSDIHDEAANRFNHVISRFGSDPAKYAGVGCRFAQEQVVDGIIVITPCGGMGR